MISCARSLATVLGLATILASHASHAVAQPRSATILGRVTRGGGAGVGYAVVAITPDTVGRFTESDGRFGLTGLNPGRVSISVKRLGYISLDTTVDLPANDTLRLTVALSPLGARLPPANSLGNVCAHPGTNTAPLPRELELLFDQVKQNADRGRLLARSYPFELTVERKVTKPEPALAARFITFDTIRVAGTRNWRYSPGKMVGTRDYDAGALAGKWLTITMPELGDFADQGFLASHCFDFGGLDLVDGDSLLRVEFRPAANLREPDVAGTLFLDRTTYELRLALMSVVNLNKAMRESIGGQAIRVTYKPLIPGVPLLNVLSSVVFPKDDPRAPSNEAATETQRSLTVRFLGARP